METMWVETMEVETIWWISGDHVDAVEVDEE